jgi:glucans biosynthesis protein C
LNVPIPEPGFSRTSTALRNLRGVVIVLILAFHSFSAYIVSQTAGPPPFDTPPFSWTAFPIIDTERWIGFDLFCAFVFLYLMQLMFFLSGLFVWPSLSRREWTAFLRRRVIRLGVPFVIGTYVLMPITFYAVYRVTAIDPAWSTFWAHWTALPIAATGPMWFLWFLLVLDIAAAILLLRFRALVLNSFIKKIIAEPIRLFIVLICVSAVLYLPLAAIYSPWQWIGVGPFEIQAAFAPQYALYFAWGVIVGICGLDQGLLIVNGKLVQRWSYWVCGSIAAFLGWIGPTALMVRGITAPLGGLQIAANLALVLFVGCACFAMLAVFLRFGTNRWPIVDTISENAYGIYFFHYTLAVWFQYVLLGWAFPAIAKGLVVFIGSLLISLAASVLTYQTTSSAVLLVNRLRRRALKSI